MIPASLDYVRAKTLNDAFKALAGRDTKVIAGGHSLLPMLRLRLARPAKLVDIAGLKELRGIQVEKGGVRIGAATTYREILDSSTIRSRLPVMQEVTRTIGDLQVRNRGTIGGALAHADPASDMTALLLALDATFNLRSKSGKRAVKAADFFKGAFDTALKKGELLIDIVVPVVAKGAGAAYASFEQPASGYPMAAAAAVVGAKDGAITSCRLAFTGVSDCAFLLDTDSLLGGAGDAAAVKRVVEAALAQRVVNDDIHCSAEYRTHLATLAAQRAVAEAMAKG
jgi:aerobic carbon-monoxide dehydrogenase medium subunit